MKNTLLILALILLSVTSFSQDVIVTKELDTIHCEITDVEPRYIFYNYTQQGEKKHSFIPRKEVATFTADVGNTDNSLDDIILPGKGIYKYRLDFSAGYSHRIVKIPGDLPNEYKRFLRDVKSGITVDGNLTYYTNDNFGLGIKGNIRSSSASAPVEDLVENSGLITGDLHADIRIIYLGPQFALRFINEKRTSIIHWNGTFGYMRYKSTEKIPGFISDITGKTLSVGMDLGYNHKILDDFYLGVQLSYLNGNLTEVDIDNRYGSGRIELQEGQQENLDRFDISAGVRYLW